MTESRQERVWIVDSFGVCYPDPSCPDDPSPEGTGLLTPVKPNGPDGDTGLGSERGGRSTDDPWFGFRSDPSAQEVFLVPRPRVSCVPARQRCGGNMTTTGPPHFIMRLLALAASTFNDVPAF